jgi:hypothetical protein
MTVYCGHAAARRAENQATCTGMMVSMVQIMFYLMMPKEKDNTWWNHNTQYNTAAYAGSFSNFPIKLLWMARTTSDNRRVKRKGNPRDVNTICSRAVSCAEAKWKARTF